MLISNRKLKRLRVFPDLEEIIKHLHNQKVKTGIVTSKTKQELMDDFYPFGLYNYFDYIVCADDTYKHKPDPEPILKCLEISKAAPTETVYIGDTSYDMQCAQSAGVLVRFRSFLPVEKIKKLFILKWVKYKKKRWGNNAGLLWQEWLLYVGVE